MGADTTQSTTVQPNWPLWGNQIGDAEVRNAVDNGSGPKADIWSSPCSYQHYAVNVRNCSMLRQAVHARGERQVWQLGWLI